MTVTEFNENFRSRVNGWLREEWGGPLMVSLGELFDTSALSGFTAEEDGTLLGALLYRTGRHGMEVASLFCLQKGRGVGRALLDAAARRAREKGLSRLWLVTTNDNTRAIRFYQKYGMELVAVHMDSVACSRRLKPGIPPTGEDGIPIRHEFEFALPLGNEEANRGETGNGL